MKCLMSRTPQLMATDWELGRVIEWRDSEVRPRLSRCFISWHTNVALLSALFFYFLNAPAPNKHKLLLLHALLMRPRTASCARLCKCSGVAVTGRLLCSILEVMLAFFPHQLRSAQWLPRTSRLSHQDRGPLVSARTAPVTRADSVPLCPDAWWSAHRRRSRHDADSRVMQRNSPNILWSSLLFFFFFFR